MTTYMHTHTQYLNLGKNQMVTLCSSDFTVQPRTHKTAVIPDSGWQLVGAIKHLTSLTKVSTHAHTQSIHIHQYTHTHIEYYNPPVQEGVCVYEVGQRIWSSKHPM